MLKQLDMSEICLSFKEIELIQFIEQQKLAKKWLPVEINLTI